MNDSTFEQPRVDINPLPRWAFSQTKNKKGKLKTRFFTPIQPTGRPNSQGNLPNGASWTQPIAKATVKKRYFPQA